MPPPAQRTRIVITGQLPGSEIFSFGWWGTGSFASESALASYLSAVVASTAFLTPINYLIQNLSDSGTYVRKISAYYYATQSNQATFQAEQLHDVRGNGTPTHPNQVAVCCTTLTGLPGRSRRGRFYLPGTHAPVSGALAQMDQETVDNVAENAANLVESSYGAGFTPAVVSGVAGTATVIRTVRVDSRLDIQRRRANRETISFYGSHQVGL